MFYLGNKETYLAKLALVASCYSIQIALLPLTDGYGLRLTLQHKCKISQQNNSHH